ncbi:MAG: hypothetical protein HY717_22940 [Planctomycetes bacterium]|nr:hypothetical protein [Planctomycetota bacterium]
MEPETLTLLSRIFNGLILGAVAVGLWQRRRPRRHVPIMIACFAVDLANVLVVELNRAAVEKAFKTVAQTGDWILKFHILVSVVCLACYAVALVTGLRLLKGGAASRLPGTRGLHKKNAAVFLICRVLNFITSFKIGG